jgi:hypothetical protein
MTAVGGSGGPEATGAEAALGTESIPPLPLATTVNVYGVPGSRVVKVQLVPASGVQVVPPGVAVTTYWATVTPLACDGIHDTTIWWSPAVAVTIVGGLGAPVGVIDIGELGTESPLLPTPVATAVNVYSVPPLRPEIVQLVASAAATQDAPPGLAVTVKWSMPAPTLPTVQYAVALLSPPLTLIRVGAPGGPGVTDGDGALGPESPVPNTPTAATVKVYARPAVSPVTVQLDVNGSGVEQVLPSGDDVTVYCAIPAPTSVDPVQDTVA